MPASDWTTSTTTNYGHFGKANLPWEKVDLF